MNAVCSHPIFRRFLAFAVSTLLLPSAVVQPVHAADVSPLPIIRVGVMRIDDGAMPYYADDVGFFKKAGLQVQIMQFSNGAAIAAAVAAGALDIGDSNLVSLVTAHTKGIPFAIIAPTALHLSDAPTSGLFVAKDSPYANAKGLDGKMIAVNGLRNITELSGRAWIDKNGGDSTTVKFIEMPVPQMPVAVEQKRVDAAVSQYPPAGSPQAAAERLLGDAYDGIAPRFLVSAYFSTADWIAKNPEAARRFMAAIHETATWANANHDKSAPIFAKYRSTRWICFVT